jgi:pseudaminic acid cytidylyltransferase
MQTRNICIIPARGGSKRIPKKNIKNFLGKPIISYSIDLALNSNIFDHIMVSTDDEEIAEIAIKHGASVPFFRSLKNSDDYATTLDVIQEVRLEYLSRNKIFDNLCCIYPTAPLIKITDLIEGYKLLMINNNDIVYPITPFSYPILRSVILDKDGNLSMKWPEFANSRSQDLEKFYHDCGQWYWYRNSALANNSFINTKSIVIDNIGVQDIDNYDDWKIAEMKYQISNDCK